MSKRIIQKYNDFNVELDKDDIKTLFDKMLKNKNFCKRAAGLSVRGVRVTKHSCGIMDINIKMSSHNADLEYVIQHCGFREELGRSDEFEPKPVQEDPNKKLIEAIEKISIKTK